MAGGLSVVQMRGTGHYWTKVHTQVRRRVAEKALCALRGAMECRKGGQSRAKALELLAATVSLDPGSSTLDTPRDLNPPPTHSPSLPISPYPHPHPHSHPSLSLHPCTSLLKRLEPDVVDLIIQPLRRPSCQTDSTLSR